MEEVGNNGNGSFLKSNWQTEISNNTKTTSTKEKTKKIVSS